MSQQNMEYNNYLDYQDSKLQPFADEQRNEKYQRPGSSSFVDNDETSRSQSEMAERLKEMRQKLRKQMDDVA